MVKGAADVASNVAKTAKEASCLAPATVSAARALLATFVGLLLLQWCRLLTLLWTVVRSVLCLVLPDQDRAPRRLAEGPRYLSVATLDAGTGASGSGGLDVGEDGLGAVDRFELRGLELLPEVPLLPDGALQSLSVAGCANLAMYTVGALYALQRAPNYSEAVRSGDLHISGSSSGAFVSAPFACGLDCSRFLLLCWLCFAEHRRRVGGCIGVYSLSICEILRRALRDSSRPLVEPTSTSTSPKSDAGGSWQDMSEEQRVKSLVAILKDGRLDVGVTRFNPWPETVRLSSFMSEQALLDSVLASCYIPVAYETPVVLDEGLGFCLDGCALDFLPAADAVISPFRSHLAEVSPEEEYPGTLNFSLLHGEDILRLFEDGYLDMVRWLQSGAASRRAERDSLHRSPLASQRALIGQGFGVAKSMLGFDGR